MKNLKDRDVEISDFAHKVSHDLRAPLRAISTLAKFIFEDNEKILDEESKNNFKLLIDSVNKMDQQLLAILQEYGQKDKS